MTHKAIHRWLDARLITLARVYFTLLFGWKILHTFFGDRWAWLFLLNTFSAYLFLPLPVICLIAWKTRRREVWLGSAIAFIIAIILYGDLFMPKFAPNANSASLSVMTYNMLGYNTARPDVVVKTIRRNYSASCHCERSEAIFQSTLRRFAASSQKSLLAMTT